MFHAKDGPIDTSKWRGRRGSKFPIELIRKHHTMINSRLEGTCRPDWEPKSVKGMEDFLGRPIKMERFHLNKAAVFLSLSSMLHICS